MGMDKWSVKVILSWWNIVQQ